MKFRMAYVPFEEKWLVFIKDQIFIAGIETEEKAENLCKLLNACEAGFYNFQGNESKVSKIEFNFDEIYKIYPRKIGKSTGLKRLKHEVKSEEKFDLLYRATLNYRDYCEREVKGKEFIMHFSTFASKWKDWIPESDVGSESKQEFSLDELTAKFSQ